MRSFIFIGVLTLTVLTVLAQDEFQYKHIVLGVVVAPASMESGGLEVTGVEGAFLKMVYTVIDGLNYTFVPSGNVTVNTTRTSNISVLHFGLEEDLYKIPEISILLSLVGCGETHLLNKKVNSFYGPLLHIALTDPGCPRLDAASSITIPLTWFHRNADLLQLLIDMRSERVLPNWKDVITINDIQGGDGVIDTFAEALSSTPEFQDIALSIYNVDSLSMYKSFSDQIEDILDTYQRTAPGKFVVITKTANINRVLEVARRKKMLSIVKQWIFIGPDPTGSEFQWDYIESRIIDDGVNIAFLMNSSSNATIESNHLFCHSEGLLILLSDVVEMLANWELELYLQVSNEEWDIIKPTRADRVINITGSMTEQLSSKVLAFCDKNSSTWNLRAGENGKQGKQIFEVGWWNPVTGLRMTDDLLPHVTGGFRGRRIDVVSMHFPPWQMITRDDPDDPMSNVTYSGLMFEVLNHMSKDLNFTYNVLEPRPGETWGTRQSDGSWSGMMKFLAENKVVIGAAAFTVTPERAQFINFTEVLEREAYGFMVNRPVELSRVLLFAAPFSIDVWLCITATVIVVAPILHLVHRMSYYYKYYKKVNEKGLFQLKNCYWYIYGSLLQQGGVHLPDAISGRMLIGFWWLFVIVTVTTYSGNLVAFLTFPKVESPVNTINDVISYKGVDSWGFLAGSVIEDHLERSTDPQFIRLYKKAAKHPAFNQSVLDLVTHRQHAYIDWKIVLLTAMRDSLKVTGTCDFLIGSETFFEEKIALAVPRGSPYLPIFNKQISQMLQTGLIKKWKSRYWPQKDRCSLSVLGGAGNRKVGIGDMQGSFYLLLLGFFIAFVVLVVEFLIFRRNKQRIIETLNIFVQTNKNKAQEIWQQKHFPFTH